MSDTGPSLSDVLGSERLQTLLPVQVRVLFAKEGTSLCVSVDALLTCKIQQRMTATLSPTLLQSMEQVPPE